MYLQSTTTECGLCCLGYVSAAYGATYEMSELRSRFAVSIQGTTLNEIISISSSIGLAARPLKAGLEELASLQRLSILHWNMNHFVVLLSAGRKSIRIFDPAKGEKHLTYEQASSQFTGIAVELTPSELFEVQKPRSPVSIRSLIGRVSGLKRSLIQIGVLAVCLQAFSLLTPIAVQWVIDGAVVSGDKGFLFVLCLGFALVSLIKIFLESARNWLSIVLGLQFQLQWSGRLIGHLFKLPLNWFELRHIGDVVSRFDSMKSIQQALTGKLIETFIDAGFGITVLIVMLLYSPTLSLIVLLAIISYALMRIIPHGKFHQINDETLVHEAKAQSHFLESIRAVQTVKLSGLEDQRRARWMNLFVDAANKRVTSQKMTIGFSAGYGLVFAIESVAVLGIGASSVIDGTLTIGMLMAFIAYKDDFSSRMQRLVDNGMSLRMLSIHTERLSDIILATPERLQPNLSKSLDNNEEVTTGVVIELKNVSYRYGGESPWILKNINLTIGASEHIAIVGASGCGKTTFAKILLGLLQPTQGEILINGAPLDQYGVSKWRKLTGAVMQEDLLFSGSLQDNIARFNEAIDLDRVKRCAVLAAIHDDIVKMPMRYQTLVGDMGSSLSGGQKQRVLLARALYSAPEVLVLDEATSHLDVEKEHQVNSEIRKLNVARIIIAHRPETIAMAERVIHMPSMTETHN
jgi:ATP-binding cassette subfamily B protein RaxB